MIIFKPKILKTFVLAVMFTELMLFTGCSSFPANPELQQSSVIGAKPLNSAIATDVIRYIGYPSHNGVRQKGSMLAGDNYSYLISTGSEQLNLLTELQLQKLQIQQPINIYRYPDNSVYFELKFNYSSADGSYSNKERRILSQICAVNSNNNNPQTNISAIDRYSCQLVLQGGIYAALQDIPSSLNLKQGLQVEIYPVSTARAKTQAEMRVVPLTVILETIELPFDMLSIIK